MISEDLPKMLGSIGLPVLEKEGEKDVWMALVDTDVLPSGQCMLHFVLRKNDLEIWLPFIRGINTPSADLLRCLLELNSAMYLGKYCLVPNSGDIVIKFNYPHIGLHEQELITLLSIIPKMMKDHYHTLKEKVLEDGNARH